MSIKLMSRVWEKKLAHNEQAILLAMADYADDNGRSCYPSHKRIAWKTGYSIRQVARIIQDLCALGVLVIVKPATQHKSANYAICLDAVPDKEPFVCEQDDSQGRQNVTPEPIQSSQNVTPEPIQSGHFVNPEWTFCQSRVDKMSTDPLVNHHRERGKPEAPSFQQPAKQQPAQNPARLQGVSYPRYRKEKRDADRIARERDALELNARELTTLTDKVLERMNALELANSDTDYGDEEFTQAQQTTLALARLGYKTCAAIDKLFDCWPKEDWRGKKGEPPTYRGMIEFAKGKNGTSRANGTNGAVRLTVQRIAGEKVW